MTESRIRTGAKRFDMRFCVFISCWLISFSAWSQFTNNWVNYNQTYYKIKVATNGIYRLTFSQLQQAGVPVTTIDPRLIQVWHRGTEQAIFFKHSQLPADANFDSDEYLEFYGRKNDGTRDAKLYQPTSAQPHPYYNLYSDTSVYFLTVNPLPVQGKRMATVDQVNSSSLPKETFHREQRLLLYTSEYSGGDVLSDVITQSFFDEGEGWTGATICTLNSDCAGNEQRDFPIDQLTNAVTTESPPNLEIQLAGRDAIQHQAEIYVGASTGSLRLVTTKVFTSFQTPKINAPLTWSDVGADGKMVVRVKAIGVGGLRDRLSVNYIKLTLPQSFNFSGITTKTLHLEPNVGGKSYVEIDNAPVGLRVWDVTDPSAVSQVVTRPAGAAASAVILNTTQSRDLFASTTFLTPDVAQIKPVVFRNLGSQANYVIVSHAALTKPGLNYANPVRAFAEYRASSSGGSYDTLTVNVDQLYDQFNYGETSPTAIFEFMNYLVAVGKPHYLFLIGKGREVFSGVYRRTLATGELRDLVPTAGTPGSDMAFTAGLKGEPFVPAVATGRLTATNPQQVAAYLNKVIESEALPFTELWRKKVLHLSGGIQVNELQSFRGYMDGFAAIAKSDYLGGEVITLGKHGISPIEFINISKEINAGLNMVTFFGHSASNATDIDIGYVSQPIFGYNNAGKYPAFLVNGCNAGEFFNNGVNFGEDWMMASAKGARAFIANSSYGFDSGLRLYTTYFYQAAFADSINLNKGIGDAQVETARRFLNEFGNTKSVFTAQVQQMVLLGDPAIKLFGASKPDFATDDASVSVRTFDGKSIHALSDSLEVSIVASNLGRATKQSMVVLLKHSIAGNEHTYRQTFASVRSTDTLRFVIRRGTGNFFGANKIDVMVDPDNKVNENDEGNNAGSWSRFIQFNGTNNLQPADFALVRDSPVDLWFQDTDVFSSEKSYTLQIDTSALFNSPFLTTRTISGKVLMHTQATLLPKDSTVYYWRTQVSNGASDQWDQASFTYIQNSANGWGQLAYDQLTENSFTNIEPVPNKKFQFDPTHVSIFIKTFGSANTTPGISGSFQVDNAEYYYSPQGFNCRNNTINLVAFDRSSVVPYLAVPFTFQNAFGRACGREPQLINSFTAAETDTGNQDDLIQYINNLKLGDSLVMFTMGDAGFASWSSAVRTKLAEVGIRSTDLDLVSAGEPVIILARKGTTPGQAKILRSDQNPANAQELQLSTELTGYKSNGTVSSVLVGPALGWHAIKPKYRLADPSDEASFDVYGVARDGKETLIMTDNTKTVSIENVDADVFPYLRLVFHTRDEVTLSPTIPRYWLVEFDPAPDGLLVPIDPVQPVTVLEGEEVTSRLSFVNISRIDFTDSLATTFTTVNQNSGVRETKQFNIFGPKVGDSTRISVATSTRNKVGLNDLSVSVNNGVVTEQYYQNNAVDFTGFLMVNRDRTNPILEVTIDGRFVLNGDFVSANPVIRATLRDENTYVTFTDTTTLDVLLTYPCSNCTAGRINFSRPDVTWSVSEGKVVFEFRPKGLEPGTYTLFANGSDASGNSSGDEPYQVSFVVDDNADVFFKQPYPNPSDNGFFFEFSAAGETAPTGFRLSIIDRTGRQVATFNENDGPPLRVGLNQFRWEGTDAQGLRLSDGVYFYTLAVESERGTLQTSGRLLLLR